MASTLQISYTSGADANGTYCKDDVWLCQTFTTDDSFDCDKVILTLRKNTSGTFGTLTAAIYATSSSAPTDSALASQTMDADTLTTNAAGDDYTFTWASPITLSGSTEYAIVLSHAESGWVMWREDSSSSSYADGVENFSTNAGSTWPYEDSDVDKMFQVWGEAAAASYQDAEGTFAVALTFSGTGEVYTGYQDAAGTFAISLTLSGTGDILGSNDAEGTFAIDLSFSGTGTIISGTISGGPGTQTKRRLVAIGNNVLYYEDL